MPGILNRVYHNRTMARLFHTTIHCLQKELAGCESILDLGCGPDSPLRYVDARRKVGIDAFEPYVESSKRLGIHDECYRADILECDFAPKSFDAAVLIGVLEHLDREEGERMLDRLELVASKKILISCPNGFLEQHDHDDNPFQLHRSGWTVPDFKARGYKVRGMSGLRGLRKKNDIETSTLTETSTDVYSTIRFRPRPVWFAVSAATQIFTHYTPTIAFELMCVKLPSSSEARVTEFRGSA